MACETQLLDHIEAIEFTEGSQALFRALTSYSAADQEAAVVLVAAATVLARQYPDLSDISPLNDLVDQFRDVVFTARSRIAEGICRPTLQVVGGTDFYAERTTA